MDPQLAQLLRSHFGAVLILTFLANVATQALDAARPDLLTALIGTVAIGSLLGSAIVWFAGRKADEPKLEVSNIDVIS